MLIDDYGHHPDRSQCDLLWRHVTAGKNKRIVMIFQPHRYSRTRDLFDDFVQVLSQVDVLIMLMFIRQEAPILVRTAVLFVVQFVTWVRLIRFSLADPEQLPEIMDQVLQDGDLILAQEQEV